MAIIFLALKVQKNNNLMSVVGGVQHDCGLHIFLVIFFPSKHYGGRLMIFLERTLHKSLSRFDLAVFNLPKRVSRCLLAVSNSSIRAVASRF